MTSNRTIAGRRIELMPVPSSNQMRQYEAHVDELDTGEWNQNATEAVDEEITPQEYRRTERPVLDTLQRERDQEHDDQRVEDHRRQDGGEWRCQVHDVERVELRIRRGKGGRNDREILRHVVRDTERRERAARHQHLLAGLHHFDEL